MTRSQFFLGLALLCVSGTLAFFISFRQQEARPSDHLTPTSKTSANERSAYAQRSHRSSPLPLSDRMIEDLDPTNYEVSVTDQGLSELGQRIESDARERLQTMTERYQLSVNQRREIFPLLVSYHAEYQEGLIVNGSSSSPPPSGNLASAIYPVLDPNQQENFQEALLADNEWWGDVIGQLREDLDGALSAGEIDLISEQIENLPKSETEGRDDGRAIENQGLNLENFNNN